MNEGDTFTLGPDRWEVVATTYLGIQNLFAGFAMGSGVFGGFGMGSLGARHVYETIVRSQTTDEHRCAIIAADGGGRIEVHFELEVRGLFLYPSYALENITPPLGMERRQ